MIIRLLDLIVPCASLNLIKLIMKKTITLLTAFISLATFSIAQIGAPAQDFTATDLDGNTHSLSGILESGKVVVLKTNNFPKNYFSHKKLFFDVLKVF